MKVDKQNGRIKFNELAHVYWCDENDRFVSVTTLISQYHEKFDGEFWARYKAFESLASKEAFTIEKKILLSTKKWNTDILSRYDIDELSFNTKVNDLLDGYEREKKVACDRGTKFHLEQEQRFYEKGIHDLNHLGLNGNFTCVPQQTELTLDKGIYPEYLIHKISKDGLLKIAGQIDLLIKDGNEITIADYKSNRRIDKKSYYDNSSRQSKKMFYPLHNLDDCNFTHYTLQLSLYAWMVEQMNPDFKIKGLFILHHDHEGNDTTYDVEYKKDDVVRMLAHHKMQNKIKLEKSKNEEIIF
jgi:hypothetical protein